MGQRNGIWVLLAAIVAVLACPSAAFAQVYDVTTFADNGNGECTLETCTLRDAVTNAGASGASATVRLLAGTYRLVDRELVLEGDVNLEGAGARSTVIQGDPEVRVAYVAPASDITVTGVSVTRGSTTGTGVDAGLGGGFRVAPRARLVLSGVTVSSNFAARGGGGISTAGEVHLEQSTVSGNDAGLGTGAPGEGAGIHVEEGGRAVLVNATVSGNFALSGEGDRPGRGGGLYTAGEFTLENATIARNDATEGGGLYQDRPDGPGMEMVNTLLAENAGRQCAGLLRVVEGHHNLAGDGSCELDGAGDLPDAEARLGLLRDNGGPTDTHALGFGSEALDAAGGPCPVNDQRNLSRPVGRACDIGAVERRRDPVVTTHLDGDDGECDPDDCTLRDALLDSERDAIIFLEARTYEVTIAPLELRHDRQVVGTGARSTTLAASGDHRVLTVPDGSPTLTDVLVTGGTATVGGGILVGRDAIFSIVNSAVAGNAAADGGGIASQGHVNLVASTIASNRSETGGGLLTESEGSAYLLNSTVTGNSATSRGGGLANRGVSVATLNTTIAGNSAASSGDAAYGDSGVTWLRNTIVAGEGEVTCDWGAEHELLVDHSLADDDDDCFAPGGGNLVQDPKLGPLASGLGPTDVYPLLDGSPAIDAGNESECPETDQRDALRFRCDIGAYEGSVSATTLRVVTEVSGGSARPADFTVRVFSGGEEVGSAPGSASGTAFTVEPGTYRVTRSGPGGYVRTFSDECDARGTVTIEADEVATCTLTVDHVPTPPDAACLDYPHFEGAQGLNLLGDAVLVDDVVLLNPASGGIGAAWFGAPRPVANGFTTDFDFEGPTPGGADGFAFVIQNQGIDEFGDSGGGLGYHRLPNSLAVEFDTFHNFEHDPPGVSQHVAVHSGGTGANDANALPLGYAQLPPIQDGNAHAVRIVYAPGTLSVFVDDMTTPLLTVPVNLASLLALDDGTAFAGFTAATGGLTEAHSILSWRLCSVPRPGTLRVVTQVVNDNGGVKQPGDFSVHVRSAGADVAGSPRPGSGGDAYPLAPGTYGVAADGVAGYSLSVGGSCAGDGTVTLAPAQTRICTVTADDVAAQGSSPPQPEEEELPPPEAGEEVNALPKSGTVRVKVAGTNQFVELQEGQQIPVGSVVDTTKGRVTIVAAGGQSADFFDGIFRLSQTKGAKPLTTLTLVEALSCPKAGKAIAAAKKKKRRLWGDGSGKFKTEGKHSAATVVGTKWLVEDRCASTLTKVTRGKVRVRDFAKRKNVTVRAGKQYVARAR